MNDFEEKFEGWLASSLTQPVPSEVCAYCINLFEPAGATEKFAAELVGTSAFDFDDDDWASDEIWRPNPAWMPIATNWSSENWPTCLERMTVLLKRVLAENRLELAPLISRDAMAVGFVDGDLEILWQKN